MSELAVRPGSRARRRAGLARTAVSRTVITVAGLTVGLTAGRAAAVASRITPPRPLARAADAVSLGTAGLFTVPGAPGASVLLNAGVTAGGWTLCTAVTLWLLRTDPGDRGRAARPMPRVTRIAFASVGVACVLEAAALGGAYLGYSRYYVSTDNATVDGDKIEINAPTSGAVTGWAIDQGSTLHTRQVVGRIRPVGGGDRPVHPVYAPGNGTVAVNDVVDGSYVAEGTELATAYDLARIYLTARVDTADIAEVRPGAAVDFTADAYPGVPMSGLVQEVQSATAGEFSDYPVVGSADPANPTRVIQYIPVKIELLDTGGRTLSPGMNVTVHISKS